MPAGNKTGPLGYGPMTGRGLGYCAGYRFPGFTKGMPRGGMGYGLGRRGGLGRGHGFGRGFGRRFYPDSPYDYPVYSREPYPGHYCPPYEASISPEQQKEDEKAYLENVINNMEEDIKAMQERLQELSGEKE